MQDNKLKVSTGIIMTPIIDVIMILLLFFMIAYSKTTPQFYAQKVDIPNAGSSEKLEKDKTTTEIIVDEKGAIFFQNQQLNTLLLTKTLSELKQKGIKNIIIRGEKKSPYEKIILVMDKVKLAGIPKVLLVTRKSNDQTEGKNGNQ
jgi:biopolymer transport protein ExbD